MIQNSNTELRKCCFLDRDGVANVEVDYLHEVEKTVLEEGFADTVKAAHANGYLAIIITNQAGIARGKFPLEDIYKVHDRIQELLAEQGEKIDAIYFCPHHPEYSGECNCRKPAPGMILKAAEEWNIDLSESLMIGKHKPQPQSFLMLLLEACLKTFLLLVLFLILLPFLTYRFFLLLPFFI